MNSVPLPAAIPVPMATIPDDAPATGNASAVLLGPGASALRETSAPGDASPGPRSPRASALGDTPAAGFALPRQARTDDAHAIHALIERNLEAGHLLPRTLADITSHAHRFVVIAAGDGELLACAELAPLSAVVAEVRSLVVHESARGLGLGKVVVAELRRRARAGRFRTLCAFTHDPRFFARFGFSIVPHFWLPEKVAADCWSCPLFQNCAQYAMIDSCLGRPPLPASGRELYS